ncbi:AraC family transcriptional regulator [Mangrovibacter sp. MFB070]|uniref:GlxA family transcriptional regulator n=1 Tax=Mangrovibacter sp. MFB070 TaxID=1224318 RepID=UPI0004D6A517|nr:helix-turn-helix domain-containing protein [Mangrovibacter sp. MFB070]KEA52986.1 AraC family transcriptional regulator [Mangrovibacter sp. MFB070]
MKRTIAMLAVPGVQLLDVSGPLDVFAEANRILQREVYEPVVIALDEMNIRASSGVQIMAHYLLEQAVSLRPDTFLLSGAPEVWQQVLSDKQKTKIRFLCESSQRYGSVCTGAFLLAQTGLLENRKITTHWAVSTRFAAEYPQVDVDVDALYVADGPIRTAAGVTSGMDLALRLVEEDLGREVTMDIANNLVMFFRRPVNQGHFIRHSAVSVTGRTAFQDLQRWTLANLALVLNINDMAVHIGLSSRHLARLFRQQMNMSAGEWLENCRIEQAKALLETGSVPVKRIAAQCGYSCSDVLRRAFIKRVGVTPSVYRRLYAARE